MAPTTTLWVGDLHVSDVPPGQRSRDYRAQIIDKLVQVMWYARDHEVDAVFFAGDIFHRKRSVPPELIAEVMDRLLMYSGPKFIVPGNHDMLANDLSGIAGRPLGLLGRLSSVHVLGWHEIVRLPHVTFAAVPYVSGMGYADLDVQFLEDDPPNRVVMVHYGITESERIYPTLNTSSPDWARANPLGRIFLAGHIHEDDGCWQPREGGTVFSPGALCRDSTTLRDHEPGFLEFRWDSYGYTWQRIPLEYDDADLVFVDTDVPSSAEERSAAEFLEALSTTTVRRVTFEGLADEVNALDVPTSVKARALEALAEGWGDGVRE